MMLREASSLTDSKGRLGLLVFLDSYKREISRAVMAFSMKGSDTVKIAQAFSVTIGLSKLSDS